MRGDNFSRPRSHENEPVSGGNDCSDDAPTIRAGGGDDCNGAAAATNNSNSKPAATTSTSCHAREGLATFPQCRPQSQLADCETATTTSD